MSRGQRRTTFVLIGVLVAATGLLGALFLIERNGAGQVGNQLTVTEQELAAARDRLADNRSTMDELGDREQQLAADQDTLERCADPAKAAIEAAQSDDSAALSTAVDQMVIHCGR
jgi:outer membrane murein-binding lipoprotein Lpp